MDRNSGSEAGGASAGATGTDAGSATQPAAAGQTVTVPQAIEIALTHHRAGRLAQAEAIYRQVLQVEPNYADAWHLLGVIAHQSQQHELACELITRAIELNPQAVGYHVNLGNALRADGRLDEAIDQYQQALALQPDYAEAHNNLGNALQALQRLDEAIACYRRALLARPDYAEACNNMGLALAAQGAYPAAIATFRQALALTPDYPEAHNNLASTLKTTGQVDLALRHYRQAIALRPDYAEAFNNLGSTLQDMGVYDAAIEHYQRALALKPDFAEAHNNLANAYSNRGDLPTAIEHFRRALALRPDFDLAYSNLLFHLNYHALNTPADYVREARRFGQRVAQRARPFRTWPAARREAGAPLRVGLVSGDLRRHPVGYFLENVLARLDHSKIEVIAYLTKPHRDDLSERLESHCAGWRSLVGLSDADAAQRIYDDGVQILVDLAGHTADNRLPMFAYRPAPVQVAWLGYFASTGLKEIDYILCDATVLPPSETSHFTEKPWRLPHCYLCFTPPSEAVEVGPLPMLRNGYPTLGCFNKLGKLNDKVLALWARVLQALPTARLLLKTKEFNNPALRDATLARLTAQGIDTARVTLEAYTPRSHYLAEYGRVDFALDPFPFTGGTTTAEALWMGVPVLTRRGDRFVSHAGESLLGAVGLETWIAADDDDYVARAQHFAANPEALSAQRTGLRAQMLASPLCDAPGFAAALAAAFEGMWAARDEVSDGHVSPGAADE